MMRDHPEEPADLLAPDEPRPVQVDNPAGTSPFLLIGDHAGTALPRALGTLGLGPADLGRHIACDLGIRSLGQQLAERLDAPFVHQHYSRLVIDCNRDPARDDAMPQCSDGTTIPGNVALGTAGRATRITTIHRPYHDLLEQRIADRQRRGVPTILVALHSFTPVMAGFQRPWAAGILHHSGRTDFALAMLAALRAGNDIIVGDNEPYRMDQIDYTIPRHAYPGLLPYVELELRQDLIGDAAGQHRWCTILAEALPACLARLDS